jgi:hypothetical protein
MSTNRRTKRRGAKPGITPEVIAAWQAADFRALHRALGLAPWEPSPLPREIIALGCSQDDEVDADSDRCWDRALPKVLAIQRKLLEVAGWPECREAYEGNLREAKEWAAYCRGLPSLRAKLRDAQDEVAYRKRLLDELDPISRKTWITFIDQQLAVLMQHKVSPKRPPAMRRLIWMRVAKNPLAQYLSGKLSGKLFRDQLSIGRSGRI